MSDTETYNIQVYNTSNSTKNYLLFQTVPVASGTPAVFTNVYQSSGPIESGDYSQVQFTMTNEYFAVLGTAPTPLGDHVKVTTGAAIPVTLSSGENPPNQPGTMGTLSTEGGDGLHPYWEQVSNTQSNEPNAYGIACDGSFEFPNSTNMFIGMGARDPTTQQVVPVATLPAEANTDFIFQPIVKYYIGTGTYEAGTVVNITEIGPVLTVDFTESTENSVVYTQGADNSYKIGPPPDTEVSAKSGSRK